METLSSKQKSYYCVMTLNKWENLSVLNYPIQSPKEGPHYFMPVFNTKEQAIKWHGSEENVFEVQAIEKIKTKIDD